MGDTIMRIIKSILSLLAGFLLSYASLLFFRYNQPIIKNVFLLGMMVAIGLLVTIGISLGEFV
jgi:O-antigen ligase